MSLRVSLGFARLPDGDLETFAESVNGKMTGNGSFPTPPVTMVKLLGSITDFSTKLATAKDGTKMDTALKNAARQKLLGDLKQLALYVQMVSADVEATILSSGFQLMSNNRAQTELEKPTGVDVTNGNTGELLVKVDPVANTSMYEARAKAEGATTWLESSFSGKSQRISVGGLTPGVLYTIEVRALGGLTGHSDWSDPVMHRSL